MIRPPALGPGARLALVAPAGPVAEGRVDQAADVVRAWGFEPMVGEHARGRRFYLAGSDAERAADFNAALRDDSIDAIWCLRGGYGVMRILDDLDWDALVRRPRPVIGFSDNTALHLAIRRHGIVSFHGPHAAKEMTAFSEDGLRRALTSTEPAGVLPFPDGGGRGIAITGGAAEGRLVGGNLSLVAATIGTPYAIQAEGALLFLEEVGEHAYRIDRLLSQLRLAGVLASAAGVVVGAFNDCPDEGEEYVPAMEEVLRDRLGDLGVPVAIGFPFGHLDDNWTLPVGVRARLNADAGTLELLEAGVGEPSPRA
jgi:muramoyltetrapeptide carboxypeptidase